MKSKATLHLILAVALALLAGVLTIRWLSTIRSGEKPKPVEQVRKADVVVAARPIAKGARLDASMVKLKPYDPEVVPSGAFLAVAEVEGRVAARDISMDDPITPDKLFPKGVTAGGLENAVEPGRRAVSVKGNKVLGAGGMITPGSKVDVLLTAQLADTKGEGGGGERKFAKMILSDVPVLATGTELETRIGKDGREELANTDMFTLLVTPEDAEKLALASDHGTLHFALRRTGDTEAVTTPGADMESLAGLGGAGGGLAAKAEAKAPEPEGVSIMTIRGAKSEYETIRPESCPTER